MKRINLLFAAVALFGMISLNSCSKCQTCSDCPDDITLYDDAGNEVSETEVCEDDAASKEEFDQGIALIEAFGCTCK
ncbi:MAG: hypothetical protein HN542_08595 [Flavobacteriales bacterium]|jgi:hypothetical protein|nr:hypothetical protein [Flavobacteriales bacterium]NCG30596.1 hypothetical protein [Bacteroidota bacterium]MBT3964296.1 hypothetical protein [Flavobacteriales bacterium]MBT4705570.1 hypothetical protein [Flavobacteriales bacterium]MBT4931109.1 hypothetical protein [Flavobacteriales bacterium]